MIGAANWAAVRNSSAQGLRLRILEWRRRSNHESEAAAWLPAHCRPSRTDLAAVRVQPSQTGARAIGEASALSPSSHVQTAPPRALFSQVPLRRLQVRENRARISGDYYDCGSVGHLIDPQWIQLEWLECNYDATKTSKSHRRRMSGSVC